MTPDEIVHMLNITGQKQLLPVQEVILRQTWEGQTYTSMAKTCHYDAAYLKKVAFELWHLLSDCFETSISKATVRSILEPQSLKVYQQQLTAKLTVTNHKERLSALAHPTTPWAQRTFPGGSVPINSAFYVGQPAIVDVAHQEMDAAGGFVRIQAPRHMGKSSLLIRMLAHATAQNYRTAYVDFQEMGNSLNASQTEFLRWFCTHVSQQLGVVPRLDDYWNAEIGDTLSCTLYFERYLMAESDVPLVLFLDDVDLILEQLDIARCFFSMLRAWHERTKRVASMQKLRLVMAYCKGFHSCLDSSRSPFHVGLPIKLPCLELSQMQQLAMAYPLPEPMLDAQTLASLKAMTGGHPYLVQLAYYHLCQGDVSLESLLQQAPTLSGIYGDHLRGYLSTLQSRPNLVAALKRVVTAKQAVTVAPMLAYELYSMGLVQLHGNQVRPSCDLYRLYFSAQFQ